MMLARLSISRPALINATPTLSRSVSYFSQRRPGKFFNASKPGPTVPQSGARGTGAVGATTSSGSVDATQSVTGEGTESIVGDSSSTASTDEASTSSPSSSSDASTSSSSFPYSTSSLPPTAPLLHPSVPLPSLHLHSFFSQHRPLLSLDMPLASVFKAYPDLEALTTQSSQFQASSSLQESDFLGEAGEIHEVDAPYPSMTLLDPTSSLSATSPEAADADIARTLARALVVQRIQASREWGSVLSQLGLRAEDNESEAVKQAVQDVVVNMDSVKRKRAKKMNKHKHKKRRKAQRAERRRLGK